MVMVMVMNSYLVQGRVQERDHYGLYGLLPNLAGDKDKIRNGHKLFLLSSLIILIMTKIILLIIILGLSWWGARCVNNP